MSEERIYKKYLSLGLSSILGIMEDQCYEDCVLAINANPEAINFVLDQTPELCLLAIKNGLDNKNLIRIDWTPEMEKEWVMRNV